MSFSMNYVDLRAAPSRRPRCSWLSGIFSGPRYGPLIALPREADLWGKALVVVQPSRWSQIEDRGIVVIAPREDR